MENDAIYEDICNIDLGDEIEKLKSKNNKLEDYIESLQLDIEKLANALTKLKILQENLAKNISSLFKTAKCEIERKDRMIDDLRNQLNDITFRRFWNKNVANSSNLSRPSNTSSHTVVKSEKNVPEISIAEKNIIDKVESKCQLNVDNTDRQKTRNCEQTNIENIGIIKEDTINHQVSPYKDGKRVERINNEECYDKRLPKRNERIRTKSFSERNAGQVQREYEMNYDHETENKRKRICQLDDSNADKYKHRNSGKAAYLGNNEDLMIIKPYSDGGFSDKTERDGKRSKKYHDSNIYKEHLEKDLTMNRQGNLEKLDENPQFNSATAERQLRSRSNSGSSGKTEFLEHYENGLEDEVINHNEVPSDRIYSKDTTDNRTPYCLRSDRDENDRMGKRKYHDSNKVFNHGKDRPANRRYDKERKFGREDLSLDRVDKVHRTHYRDRIFGRDTRNGRIPNRSERMPSRDDRFFNRYRPVNVRYSNRDRSRYADEWTNRIGRRKNYCDSDEWFNERDRLYDDIRDIRISKYSDRGASYRIDENASNRNLDQD